MTDKKIPGTDEAWETGLLGNDAEFAIPLSAEQQTVADAAVADALDCVRSPFAWKPR